VKPGDQGGAHRGLTAIRPQQVSGGVVARLALLLHAVAVLYT
jgi:hypothetical protein